MKVEPDAVRAEPSRGPCCRPRALETVRTWPAVTGHGESVGSPVRSQPRSEVCAARPHSHNCSLSHTPEHLDAFPRGVTHSQERRQNETAVGEPSCRLTVAGSEEEGRAASGGSVVPSTVCRGAPVACAAACHWACSTLPRAVVPSCGGLVCSWENLHGVTGVTGLVLQTRDEEIVAQAEPWNSVQEASGLHPWLPCTQRLRRRLCDAGAARRKCPRCAF